MMRRKVVSESKRFWLKAKLRVKPEGAFGSSGKDSLLKQLAEKSQSMH